MGDSEDVWHDPRPWYDKPEEYEKKISSIKKENKVLITLLVCLLTEFDQKGDISESLYSIYKRTGVFPEWFWEEYKIGLHNVHLKKELTSTEYFKTKKPDQ